MLLGLLSLEMFTDLGAPVGESEFLKGSIEMIFRTTYIINHQSIFLQSNIRQHLPEEGTKELNSWPPKPPIFPTCGRRGLRLLYISLKPFPKSNIKIDPLNSIGDSPTIYMAPIYVHSDHSTASSDNVTPNCGLVGGILQKQTFKKDRQKKDLSNLP